MNPAHHPAEGQAELISKDKILTRFVSLLISFVIIDQSLILGCIMHSYDEKLL